MISVRRFIPTALAIAVIFAGLGLAAEIRRELGGDYDPPLFFGELFGEPLEDYEGVAVVAHNSGNARAYVQLAQNAGVPIIEMDIRTIDNQLYAAHSPPARFVGRYLTNSVPLANAWAGTAEAPAVALDLKDSSDTFLRRLFVFLEQHQREDQRLLISSRSEYALTRAREALPGATLLLSVSTWGQLDLAQTDPQLISLIDGVTVRKSLLAEEEEVRLLKEQGLLVYAWVVNDLDTLNRLVAWGVDAVVTDNLAIIALLAPDIEDDLEAAEEEADSA